MSPCGGQIKKRLRRNVATNLLLALSPRSRDFKSPTEEAFHNSSLLIPNSSLTNMQDILCDVLKSVGGNL